MESTFTIVRIRGIRVGANWTWLIVFTLVLWSLTSTMFPQTYPGLSRTAYIGMGITAAVLLFGSVLLHELGHALRAIKEGMRIHGITLWLLGGVAQFSGMFPRAGAEFRIAVAGPAVSALLAVSLWLVTLGSKAVGLPDAIVGVADYLARINVILFAFNLVPALPLDGGRVLRSWLWNRLGNFQHATVLAARAGIGFGILLIATGLLDFLTGAGGAGGLWLLFLGWFLIQAAQAETQAAFLQEALRGRRVADLMTPDPVTVGPSLTIDRFLDGVVTGRGHSTYPVVDYGGLRGLMSLQRAGAVPSDKRARRTVSQQMWPAHDLPVVHPEQPMEDALDVLMQGPRRAVVVKDERVVGIVSLVDVMRAIELEQLRRTAGPTPRRSAGVAVWVVVGALMLAAASYLLTPPIVALRPGATLDVSTDISITGVPVDQLHGRYLLTSVELDRPNGLEAMYLAVTNQAELVPLSQIIPEDAGERLHLRQQRELFRQSQTLAAAAAARVTGMPVSVSGKGARVVDVVSSSPAASVLEPGDVIVGVDGRPVRIASDLQTALTSRPAGSAFELTVVRGDVQLTAELESRRLEQLPEGGVGIGVVITTRDFVVDLPFEIEFRERNIGGPSAGLAYALAITDMLDPQDIAAQRTIGATGTIDLDGKVGPIGGVDEKAAALVEADADLFLVPERQVDEISKNEIEVRGVSSLEEAITLLGLTGTA